jgi:hypothetical protein
VEVIFIIMKSVASLFLLGFFVAGIFKANPRTHNPEYPPLAEYGAGFIVFIGSIVGFYYLWLH